MFHSYTNWVKFYSTMYIVGPCTMCNSFHIYYIVYMNNLICIECDILIWHAWLYHIRYQILPWIFSSYIHKYFLPYDKVISHSTQLIRHIHIKQPHWKSFTDSFSLSISLPKWRYIILWWHLAFARSAVDWSAVDSCQVLQRAVGTVFQIMNREWACVHSFYSIHGTI